MVKTVPIPKANTEHRRTMSAIFGAVVEAIAPQSAVERWFDAEDYDPGEANRVFVLGAGKASIAMTLTVEARLGDRVAGGVVVTRRGDDAGVDELQYVEVVEAAHPVPDESCETAARRLLEVAEQAGEDDLVICVISGGGSALTTLPAPSLSIEHLQRVTKLLLESGATIVETNAMRKHLSAIAGGRLAAAIEPARHLSLILSDVIGAGVDAVASGLTVADPTTFHDAWAVVDKFELADRLPTAVVDHLRAGLSREVDETLSPGAEAFRRGRACVVGDVELAVCAAAESARNLGWDTAILSTTIDGEAGDVAGVLASIAQEIVHRGRPFRPPICLIAGGETTVTVTGNGRGGRNQELALAALHRLAGEPQITLATLATDGIDGPTDAAGAIADAPTWQRAQQAELDPKSYLQNNDSFRFFEETGDLIFTGATGSNVNDLVIILVGHRDE